jgi:hypothetical protein
LKKQTGIMMKIAVKIAAYASLFKYCSEQIFFLLTTDEWAVGEGGGGGAINRLS